ncbi:hypothetical protein ['Fragaria x ananassa' phyllody phytoplasma]|uniref:hypothetical protein n=1 Tax='Fragaria x ananassa' phyllody phytoplasma TaxID=2358428 RepID=UPI001BAA2D01|nr:hypothetical protein ['Fragaria x ananassa' phyllody phytoplasma]
MLIIHNIIAFAILIIKIPILQAVLVILSKTFATSPTGPSTTLETAAERIVKITVFPLVNSSGVAVKYF